MPPKRVAIIGAGLSGLASIKACVEQGLEPVCFEQDGNIGGIWYQTDEFRRGQNARIYDSLILNTSKAMVCFSDFPFPENSPTYPTGKQMHGYLKDYAQKFGLLKFIQLNTSVHSVRRSPNYTMTGCWDIETESDGIRKWTTFDAVLVCVGFMHVPHYPTIEGFDKFKGSIEHSQTFKTGSRYHGQNILVIGNSNSAGDVAADVSRYAAQVYLCVGKGSVIIPRLTDGGLPVDFSLTRILTYIPISSNILGKLIYKKANARLNHMAYKLLPNHLPPKGASMVNDEITMRLACGQVKIAGSLARFGERQAEFADGTMLTDIDGVIFATGYKRKLPFLDPIVGADEDRLQLYNMMFPVQLPHNSMAMIGYFRTMGPVTPITELQSRLAAQVFSGSHTLPDRLVMRRAVDQWNEQDLRMHGCCRYVLPNIPFQNQLAKELGIRPSLLQLLKLGFSVTYQYYLGPAFTVHHRLVGPGAWAGAVQACAEAQHSGYSNQLRKLPRTRSRSKTYNGMLLLLLASGIVVAYVNWGNMWMWVQTAIPVNSA